MLRRQLDDWLLLLCLVVVALRPLVGETFDAAGLLLTQALDGASDPWASTTLGLNAAVLAACTIAFLCRCRAAGTWRHTPLEWPLVILAVSVAVSVLTAGEQRVALNASIDWVTSLLLLVALVQWITPGWRLHLTLVAVLAPAVLNAAECAHQRFIGFAATEAQYQENRDEIWARQGVPLDSPQVKLFERRMQAREASGHLAHSNVTGGYLVLTGFLAIGVVGVGLVAGRADRRVIFGCAGAAAALIWIAVPLTRSTGAMVAAATGFALLAIRWRWPLPFEHHRRRIFLLGWLIVALAGTGVVVVGIVRDGLPHPSLDFRWDYWCGTSSIVREHPWTGVGAENFGGHYLVYKTIDSPEEVRNPHNFLAHLAAEHGVVAALAFLALLVTAAWTVTAPAPRGDAPPAGGALPDERYPGWPLVTLMIAIPLCRAPFWGSDDPAVLFLLSIYSAPLWIAACAGLGYSLRRVAVTAAMRPLMIAGAAGLFAFFLQDTINFALFVPPVRTTVVAVVAICISLRAGGRSVHSAPRRIVVTVLCVIALVTTIVAWVQVERSESALRRARFGRTLPAPSLRDHPAHVDYQLATRLDPLDPAAPVEHARWLFALARQVDDSAAVDQLTLAAVTAIEQALDRAPGRAALHQLAARILTTRFQVTTDLRDLAAAVTHARTAIDRYPTRPLYWVGLGDVLALHADCSDRRAAIEAYRQAMALDDARPVWETLRRLGDRQRADINTRLTSVATRVRDECPPTSPP